MKTKDKKKRRKIRREESKEARKTIWKEKTKANQGAREHDTHLAVDDSVRVGSKADQHPQLPAHLILHVRQVPNPRFKQLDGLAAARGEPFVLVL